MSQNQKNSSQLTGEEEHRRYLEEKLLRETELKQNAETSLQFLIDKFTYLFDYKKRMISEIEEREKEIKELTNILK